MRDRNRQRGLEPDRLTSGFRAPVKRDRRLASASSTNFDLAPADAADSETEHLRDGFLRRPPTREMQDVRAAVHLLPLGIDAIEEASRMLLEHIADPRCLDDVDADFRAHKGNPQSVARRVAPVSGVCASRGCPGDPPRGMSEANDAVGGEGAASARPRTASPSGAPTPWDRTRRAPEARFIRQ